MAAEEEETYDIDGESDAPHDHHEHGVLDGLGDDQPLDGLHEDGEAQGDEEHCVDQRAKHLRARPAKRVLLSVPFGDLQS